MRSPNNTSSHMQSIQLLDASSQAESIKNTWKIMKIKTLSRSGRKTATLVRDLEYFIATKFHQNPSSGSGEKVENMKVYVCQKHRRTAHYVKSSHEPSAQVS